MNWQAYWKAILAFVGAFGTNVVVQLTQHAVPWPTNGGEWARFLVSVLGTTVLVAGGPSNKAVGKHESGV
jgi:uncharacterized membrane protein YeaQ/YmgE (transglycosylase-associated protein family)